MGNEEPQRLSKVMAHRGLCSRREAESWIEAGRVLVDGECIQTQGVKVLPSQVIEILPDSNEELRWTALINKPEGVVSHLPQPGQETAWQLLRADRLQSGSDAVLARAIMKNADRGHVAGRLDRASRGLLLLSLDGRVVRWATSGTGEVEKVYRVQVEKQPAAHQVEKLRGRMFLDDQELRPMGVEDLGGFELEFRLREGRKHHIRRVCRRVGLNVMDLQRVSLGPLELGDLPEGWWRPLRAEELPFFEG